MKHIISLGAGVQSSTMALMAARGEITPMPDAAVFADTQCEPAEVYQWLGWLMEQLPFPVHQVTIGNLEQDVLNSKAIGRVATPPFFTAGVAGKEGKLHRQCTRDYKINPINEWCRREVLGLKKGQRAPKDTITQWIGISTDESHRAKLSKERWAVHRWPLLEKDMNRAQCLEWLQKNYGRKAPKSACRWCPFHDNEFWKGLRDNQPVEWAKAVEFDRAIRIGVVKGVRAEVFVHKDCVPLDQVDLRNAEDAGQQSMFDENGFAVECEGMCGL